jgi:hypothetical protein
MRKCTALVTIAAAFVAVIGCKGGSGDALPVTGTAPAPPSIIGGKKAANNMGGAAMPVGAAPAGSGFQTGAPVMGQKATGG